MAKLDGHLVVLLNIGQALSLDDLQRLADVGNASDLQQSA